MREDDKNLMEFNVKKQLKVHKKHPSGWSESLDEKGEWRCRHWGRRRTGVAGGLE